jgi:hypothetical protein
VAHLEADVHHRAGLSCVDCHTGPGLMGGDADDGSGVDIQCSDCHNPRAPTLTLEDWPQHLTLARRQIPFPAGPEHRFLTTSRGTPLWHIEWREGVPPLLYRKRDGRPLPIPQLSPAHRQATTGHDALTCDACHAQWAPQCFGCHIAYDPGETQWDHVAHAETAGAWHEQRWDIRNLPPVLGHTADGRIGPFVPGMIMTIDHPELPGERLIRRFAPLHPHTTGKPRDCAGCHHDAFSLGLGSGTLSDDGTQLRFVPQGPARRDGLPADAWTSLERPSPDQPGAARPFSPAEMTRIYRVIDH